jgi:hypothetical protein
VIPLGVAALLGLVTLTPGALLILIACSVGAVLIGRRCRRLRAADGTLDQLATRDTYRSLVGQVARPSLALAYIAGIGLFVAYLFAALAGVVARMFSQLTTDDELKGVLESISDWTFLLLFAILAATAFPYRWAARRARRAFDSLLEMDDRSPLLLLRSFGDDGLRVRARRSDRHSVWERVGIRRRDRFEEIVAFRLWRVGPVIAVGHPGRPMPPLGAARQYFGDDWESAVRHYLESCQLIVVVVGVTEGVALELGLIKEHASSDRTLFVLPPVRDVGVRMEQLDRTFGWNLATSLDVERDGFPLVVVVEDDTPVVLTARRPSDLAYEAALDDAMGRLTARAFDRPPVADTPSLPPFVAEPRRPLATMLRGGAGVVAVLLACAVAVGLPLVTLRAVAGAADVPVIPWDPPSTTFSVGGRPLDVAALGTSLLVADIDGDRLLLVTDVADPTVTSRFDLPGTPAHVALTDSFVGATIAGATTFSMSPRDHEQVVTIELGGVGRGAAAMGDKFVVSVPEQGEVALIDPVTSSAVWTTRTGGAPLGIAVDGETIEVVDVLTNEIVTIDGLSGEVISRRDVGELTAQRIAIGGPTTAAVGPSDESVLIESAGVIEKVPLPALATPTDVAVSADGIVYVGDSTNRIVWRLDPASRGFHGVAAGPSPDRLTAYGTSVAVALTNLGEVGVLD